MDLKHWDAVATLVGVIIGAGILGLPFIIAQAGLIPGLTYLIGMGLIFLVVNLMVGEIALRTEGDHQLVGYARKYLGRTGGRLMLISLVIGIYGALIAYLIGMGNSFEVLFGGVSLVWSLLVFVLLAVILAQKLEIIALSERYLTAGKLLVIAAVIAFAFSSDKFSLARSFTPTVSWTLPYGVVLFAYLGTAVIPEVREEMKGQFQKLKSVLVWSSIIPIVAYVLFAVIVIGVTGQSTSAIATIGLGAAIGKLAIILLNLFAVLALASAFVALGEALKKTYEEDYGWLSVTAWAATLIVPITFIIFGASSFIRVLGITGAFAGGIDGILIVFMYRNARKHGTRKPEFSTRIPVIVQGIIVLIFAAGIVWAFQQVLKAF